MSSGAPARQGGARARVWVWMLALLLVLGVAARLVGIWCFRNTLNPDAAIVFLMARHMAAGLAFPVFFYGQPYMGSLEPAVSALLVRLFGESGAMVCLGTALFGMALLPVVYAWGRDSAGRRAGLLALAFVVVGPGGFFHYQASPRGGYAVAVLLSALLPWWGARLAAREREGVRVPATMWFVLGLAAGVGWWTLQLVLPALLAVAAVLAWVLRGRLVRMWVVPAGVAGFALGSAPFWWWNFQHGWASFALAESFQRPAILRGLQLFFHTRWFHLMGWNGSAAAVVAGACLLALVAVTVVWRARGARRQGGGEDLQFAGAGLFILFSALQYAASHFSQSDTPRYMLPIVPVFAVLFGAATDAWLRTRAWPVAWIPLAVLVASQVFGARFYVELGRKFTRDLASLQQAGAALEAEGVRHVVGGYIDYAANPRWGERVILSDAGGDRYVPYGLAVEQAERVAVLNGLGRAASLVAASGGGFRAQDFGRYVVEDRFTPPGLDCRDAPAAWIRRVRDDRDRDAMALFDGYLHTGWGPDPWHNEEHAVIIEMDAPRVLCGLRAVTRPDRWPDTLAVDGRADGADDWEPLLLAVARPVFYWSVARPYVLDGLFRVDLRFPATEVTALRLRVRSRSALRLYLRECALLTPGEALPSEAASLDALAAHLAASGASRVYADRGVAAGLRARGFAGELVPDPAWKPGARRAVPTLLLTVGLACVVRRDGESTAQAAFAASGLPFVAEPIGPWSVWRIAPGAWRPSMTAQEGLLWLGWAPLQYSRRGTAAALLAMADAESSDASAACELARRAWEVAPPFQPAATRLAAWSLDADAPKWRTMAAAWEPRHPARVAFANGAVLLGVTPGATEAIAGGRVAFKYFWHWPANVMPTDHALFVHFRGPGPQFQDDHVVLEGQDVSEQVMPEVFIEHRTAHVPAGTPPGAYAIHCGMLDRRTGRRIRVLETELPSSRNAVPLPVQLVVTAGTGTARGVQ